MNENARKWVAALRSGNYEQTTHRLRGKKGFCCLGIACDLYMKATGKGEWKKKSQRFGSGSLEPYYGFEIHDGEHMVNADTILPQVVMDWIGIHGAMGGYVKSDGTAASLDYDNDLGMDFSEIADIIESEPEYLFRGPKAT